MVLPLLAWVAETPLEFEKYWPQWRGPHATGVAPHGNPPVEWNESKNIRSKIALGIRRHDGEYDSSPVAGNGMVYLTSGFRGNALHAIRLAAAKGDITDSEAIVWKHDRDTPYVPSPLLNGEMIYFLKSNNGILSCFNAKTGQEYYSQQRLEGIQGIYASPVGARDRVYFLGRNGVTLVIKHGPQFEVLAQNTLADDFEASPAIVENEMYLRGRKYLYCIAED
jgi:outer membrane protein assembly factor BamB